MYVSINLYLELTPSRRDDLESWFYCLAKFLLGNLPWEFFGDVKHEKAIRGIRDIKQSISPGKLCAGMPPDFLSIYKYIRSLTYE
jgi:hypothetical protein